MTLRSTRSSKSLSPIRSFSSRPLPQAVAVGVTVAAMLACPMVSRGQDAAAPADASAQPAQSQSAPAATQSTPAPAQQNDLNLSNKKPTRKERREAAQESKKEQKVVSSKDTRKEDKKLKKDNPLAGMDAKLPDKALYDKAEDAVKRGHYDVARLDLQTLLNTYPDSQYQMRAKLAIADSWYKEGGTAALTQAEQEYKDFITFFPNAPEAAEAQMRVGDIYFRQMDKPDRDYSKTLQAEQEYRLMLQQFPDSPLVPQARQRLREVQETLASREADIAGFYASHNNWPATIARYQTVIDTYPLYSHLDEVLIGVGDAYEAEARFFRAQPACSAETAAKHLACLPEDAKARLVKTYDDQAANAYRKVVLEHSATPHVEDAKDRLASMNLPIPTPTPEQAAASAALENSRGQYTLSKRATLMFLHRADTVQAATTGEPPLEDPKAITAPSIVNQIKDNFTNAVNPGSAQHSGTPITANTSASADGSAPAANAPAASATPSLQDVPAANTPAAANTAVETTPADTSAAPATTSGTGVGMEIVPSSGSAPPTRGSTAFPGTSTADPALQPAASDSSNTTQPAQPAAAQQTKPADNGGIGPVGPTNNTPLAPIEKPAAAPDSVNEAAGQPNTQATPANGNKKPEYFPDTESSSKHKKKKGLGKINPF
jgi:outer membrane protein assembly factor BamD